jgi:hypothetical protein
MLSYSRAVEAGLDRVSGFSNFPSLDAGAVKVRAMVLPSLRSLVLIFATGAFMVPIRYELVTLSSRLQVYGRVKVLLLPGYSIANPQLGLTTINGLLV